MYVFILDRTVIVVLLCEKLLCERFVSEILLCEILFASYCLGDLVCQILFRRFSLRDFHLEPSYLIFINSVVFLGKVINLCPFWVNTTKFINSSDLIYANSLEINQYETVSVERLLSVWYTFTVQWFQI